MATLKAGEAQTVTLTVGKKLTITASIESTALVEHLDGNSGIFSKHALSAEESIVLGEYFEQTQIRITSFTGTVDFVESDSTDALGVTATDTELNEYAVSLDIADGSAENVYYVLCPHAGTIKSITTVINDVVSTADITVTAKIGANAVTDGVITIATSGSAAGDIDTTEPTAANVVAAGQAVNFTVAGGGAGGSPRIHLMMIITR